jgi:hypothetical protein
MTAHKNKDHLYFDLAFELAYFIHAHKEVAFFVAEDALDELPLMLGKQETNRKQSRLLNGFWKGGERTRPIRQTIRLNERQMLQWLCYKQSEPWERQTEKGEGLYSPTEEDMIVRYLAHLLFLTLRRGSFYVSLAIGQLLHQFDRRETRLFYDVLTQSDSARMKDTGYIGKQRLQLLGRVCERFDTLIQTTKTPGGERQIVVQPATRRVIKLVHECLRRFTPWGTTCIIDVGFDVTDIPGLYSSGADIDEDRIEMDRLHTVVDPDCFARFAEGLSKYVRNLPDDIQDKCCNFDSPDQRLGVPKFFNISSGPSLGERLQPPILAKEDYVRLERTLDARARRRKTFTPRQLSVYVDGRQAQSFDLNRTNRADFFIGAEAGVIEVRGGDEEGELTLATLLVEFDEIPVGGAFKDSVVDKGGHKVEIQLKPIRDAAGVIEGAQVQVIYAAPRLVWPISRLTMHLQQLREISGTGYALWLRVGVALLLTVAAFVVIWFQLRPSQRGIEPQQQAEQPPAQAEEAPQPTGPRPPVERSHPLRKIGRLIARANWSTDPKTALRAVTIEPTRGEVKIIDFSRRQTRLFLSLPLYDDDRTYTHYRITLAMEAERLWQQTLRAPANSLTGNAHILNLVLSPGRLDQKRPYDLQVEGRTQAGWKALGHVLLSPRA